MKHTKAAIFDLDGTLIDSLPSWQRIDRLYLESQGIPPDEEYHRVVTSLTFEQASAYIADKYGRKSAQEIEQDFIELALSEYTHTIPLKDGVTEYIHALHASGVRIAIATSAVQSHCEAILKRFDLLQYFDFIIYSKQFGCSKADPAIFVEAARLLGVDYPEITVYEDMHFALRTAHTLGMRTVGVLDSFSEHEHEKLRQWADICITDFRELL